MGVPKFIHGHNPRVTHTKPKPERVPCECKCGQLANHGKRFVSGHNRLGGTHTVAVRKKISAAKIGARNPQYGKVPHNYRGFYDHPSGYIMRHVVGHPFGGKRNHVMEHRLVMEQHLRDTDPDSPYLVEIDGELYIPRHFEVHHDDEDKRNNVVTNLKVMTKAEHTAHHARLRAAAARRAAVG